MYPRSCEKWILKTIGRDWRKFKSSLKKAIFNPAIEKNPDIKRKALYKLCPDDVDKDQWRGLIKFWKSKKGRVISKIPHFYVLHLNMSSWVVIKAALIWFYCIITGPN
jgi:hypothetical protein